MNMRLSLASALAAGLAVVPLLAAPACADDYEARAGTTLGARAMFFDPKGADDGSWSGGGQLRFHLSPTLAIEGSADWRQNTYQGTVIDVYPVQASLLVYLLPHQPVSPLLIGGGGWYHTKVRGQSAQNRFGPHAGAGLEWFLHRNWSIDATYRYVWLERFRDNPANPLRRDYDDSGSMVTAGINYRW